MGRSRTVSFKGAAAKAYVEAAMGKLPATDNDKLERIATFIFGHVQSGDMAGARLILKIMLDEGADSACAAVSAR